MHINIKLTVILYLLNFVLIRSSSCLDILGKEKGRWTDEQVQTKARKIN